MVLHRDNGLAGWTAGTLTNADTLALPEVGIEISVAEFSEDVAWDAMVMDAYLATQVSAGSPEFPV